jgi:hypothetical protein
MDIEAVLRDLANALAATGGPRGREARLRLARQIVADRCARALGIERSGPLAAVIRLAADAQAQPARRNCAVLLLHTLSVPGLIPPVCHADVCSLMEGALRNVLLRCGYPFRGATEEKIGVLARLHASIDTLLEPLEPTFPNWQGLYAG